VIEDFTNDGRIFNSADDSDFSTAFWAESDIDIKNPLQELGPWDSVWFLCVAFLIVAGH
jgi:hypothetical protein